MVAKIGFDNAIYVREQKEAILKRVEESGNKLYLEFGGKLLFDYHASRVLPGFDPNTKIKLLQELSDDADIIVCIYAGDIERKKVRADFGITYDADAMKLIDDLRDRGIGITAVVITRYNHQPAATAFKSRLERRGIRVYTHKSIPGYPADLNLIVSENGYGANDYIETKHRLVVVTAPGPNSGKLSTCLCQLYHEYRRGVHAGYAKFETFPIWNLPLKHPVNIAYEAATVDLKDANMIDSFHMEAYGKVAINYNRDIDAFPVLKRILERITGKDCVYKSPTDMGVNRAGSGIFDDAAVQEASKQEIIRRYFKIQCEYALGLAESDSVDRALLLVEEVGCKPEDRIVVPHARQAAAAGAREEKGNDGIFCGAAIELPSGEVIVGKNSPLMHAAASAVLNAGKHLAGLPDSIHLIPPLVMDSIAALKKDIYKHKTPSLDVAEVLIALSVSVPTNPMAAAVLHKLRDLNGCDMHLTHIPTPGDDSGLRKLGVHLTSDPNFPSRNLFAG
jgi:uncharacterized protein (UPF0371 family)